MRIALITNFKSRGLALDADILASCAGAHEIRRWQWTEPQDEKVDLAIHLEVIGARLLVNAKQNWFVPNLEFLTDAFLAIACGRCFDQILAKTSVCYELLSKLAPEKTVFTGFDTNDYLNQSIPRIRAFLHIAGNSQLRNTQAVLDAWRIHKIQIPLLVISKWFKEDIPFVSFRAEVKDEELPYLLNRYKYHILPSEVEGWGHVLHQSMLVGAQILTTDEEPMRSCGQFLLPAVGKRPLCQSSLCSVSADDVAEMVEYMTKHPMPSLRPRALEEANKFKEIMKELL